MIGKTDSTFSRTEPLSLRDLRSFVAVARSGGVTRAARELGYAQATVSMHVAALEAAFGLPLLAPDRRGGLLTEAGRAVLAHAAALLQDAAKLGDIARATDGRFTVMLAAVEPVASHRLPAVLAKFARERPDVHVELSVAGHASALALVDSGDAAFAIAARPLTPARDNPQFTRLYEDPMIALVPSRHRLARVGRIDLAELAGESLLVSNDACAYRALVVGAMRESNIDVALHARFGDAATLTYGVAAGLGVAVLPRGFFEGVAAPAGTVVLALRRPSLAATIGLIRPRERRPQREPERALCAAVIAALTPRSRTATRR